MHRQIVKRRRRFTSLPCNSHFGSRYKIGALYFKAQKTVLETILKSCEELRSRKPKKERSMINEIISLIKRLLNVNISELYVTSEKIINELNVILNEECDNEIEKLVNRFMIPVISFIRLENYSMYDKNTRKISSSIPPKNSGESITECDSKIVVCRICDELVPIEQFEIHTSSCITAYKLSTELTNFNKDIKKLMDCLAARFLALPWTADMSQFSKCLPMLHLYNLLKQAVRVNPDIHDSVDELDKIYNSIVVLPDKIDFLEPIRNSLELIDKKLRYCYIISQSRTILKDTRVSGSGSLPNFNNMSIHDFHFIKRISRGAYARVFLAKKKNTGDLYAIKVQKKSEITQKNQVKRVLTEKDILLNLSNPYIVDFYYSIATNQNIYIVMEYLPGGDLFSLLHNLGSVDEESVRIYVAQIITALNYLHKEGIVHRDLKPDNVLISKTGTIKLTDFGLSYMGVLDRSNETNVAKSVSFVGTPDYIAPEILMNKNHDSAVDYWSLGVMIYEMLFGEPPFHGKTESETFTNILRRKLIFSKGVELSPEVIDFMQKLLIVDPSKRMNYNDVRNHPWMKGVDFDNLIPPFVPELDEDTDTQYFSERYSFDEDDKDILLDLKENPNEYTSPSEEVLSDFNSVSVSRLLKSNQELVKKYRSSAPEISFPETSLQSLDSYSSTDIQCDNSPLNDENAPPVLKKSIFEVPETELSGRKKSRIERSSSMRTIPC